MAEASSEQKSVHIHQNFSNAKTKEKEMMALDTTVNSADLYRMCKKIAQLTKVIYNLNVKNDELEIYQSRLQHDYEKKVWKLTADVQQHVSNAASLMRTETTRSAELSQLRTHLDEQMALSESLTEELSQAQQQHTAELSAAADESERCQAAQRAALAEAEAAQQSQRAALAKTETELAAERAARLSSVQEADGLQQRLQQLQQSLQEELDRAHTWRAENERAAAESEQRAETEAVLRRELASQVASQQREVAELCSQLDSRQQQLVECRSREQQLGSQLTEQLTQRERLTAELAAAATDLRERDAQLLERDSKLQEHENRLATLTEHLQSRCDQLHSQQAQLEASRQQLRQQAAEMERVSDRLQTLQTEGAAARTRADQLSQLLMARDATISRLESELAAAEGEAAAAAAAAVPPPAADTTALLTELERVRQQLVEIERRRLEDRQQLQQSERERDEAREQLEKSEAQREEQAELMQAALEESVSLEAECRRRVEALQTVTEEREQQLMEDAETRLREVRRDCKRKLDEQQRAAKERLSTMRQTVEAELHSERLALDEQGASVDRKLAEMEVLRSFEAEVVQLRGLTHELMRELRVGTRQVELCRVQEARTAEENRRLTELISKHNSSVNSVQKEQQQLRLQLEQQLRLQADQERSALDAQWEDRLREERRTLKAELDCLHSEEKHLAVESIRLDRQQQLQETGQCVRQLQRQLECAADEVRQLQIRHQMELEQREHEAEAIISDLHRQLQTLNITAVPEKHTGPAVMNGGVGDSDRTRVQSPGSAGSSEVSDTEDGGGDARSRIERALRGRPQLRAALDSLLVERDRQAALLQQQLTATIEQGDRQRAEKLPEQLAAADSRAGQLQEQLAAAGSRAEQLRSELTELRRDHDRLSQLLVDRDREQLSGSGGPPAPGGPGHHLPTAGVSPTQGSGVQQSAALRASGDNETTNEVSLPCIESERILNALDLLLVKLRTVLRLPKAWGQLVEQYGHHVAEPLAQAVATYLQLRDQFHEDAERLRTSVPPPSSSHSLETFDVTDTGAAEVAEPVLPLAPSNGLLGTLGADERCVAVLAETIERLAAATRHLVRQWCHYAEPAGLDGHLDGPCSPPAQQFLLQMALVRRQMYLRLVTTPDQEASRTERLREIWRRDNHNRQVLATLQTRLDSLLQERADDRRIKTAVIDQLETQIASVERKSTEDVANVIAEIEGDITAARAAYQMYRDRVLVIYDRNMAGLEQLRVSNREAEAALKKRKYKIESELENWLQKYDSEMIEKTEQIEGLQAEFEKETAEREEFDAKVEAMRDRYESIILKREREAEMRIFEERLAIKKAAAALYIQAFWRGYRVRKRLKKKKGKKGKGKKGKKGGKDKFSYQT